MERIITFAAVAGLILAPMVSFASATETAGQFADRIADEEKTVVDAVATSDGRVVWAGVRPNGSSRDGFAEYLCMDAPESVELIRIMDMVEAAKGQVVVIGTAFCK